MLDTLRSGATHIVVKVILFLLALSFVAWGVGDIFHGRASNAVATIGRDGSISKTELDRAVHQQVLRIQQRLGKPLTEDQIKMLNLSSNLLGQMINRKLIEHAAAEQGLQVSDAIIRDNIITNPMFLSDKGQFDKDRYTAVLRNNSLSEAAYVANLRSDITTQFLLGTLVAVMPVPDPLVSLITRYKKEQRIADILTITQHQVTDVSAPTAAEISNYYEAHKGSYTAPEIRNITYVTLSSDDVAQQITVSDSELRTEFDNSLGEYQKGETRDIGNVIFQDEAQAKAAWKELQHGNVAQKMKGLEGKNASYSVMKSISKNDLPEEVRAPVFALEKGAVSAPLKSSFGWHIFHIAAIYPPKTPVFAEHREELLKKLTHQKAETLLSTTATKLEDEFASGTTLEEVANKYKLKIAKIEGIDSKGEGVDGKKNASLPHVDNFLSVAFATDAGTESPLSLTPDNSSYFIIRTDKVMASHPKTLDEVRPQVVEAQKAAKQQEASRKLAEDIQRKLKAGASMEEMADRYHISLSMAQAVGRLGDAKEEVSKTPNDLRGELFSLKKGGISAVHQSVGGDFLIGEVTAIRDADLNDKEAKDDVRHEIEEQFSNDIAEQYFNYLRTQYPVSVSQVAASSVEQ